MTKKVLPTAVIVKVIATVLILMAALLVPASSYAKTVCIQYYGGAVECYEEEEVLGEVHEVIETDLADINPATLGIVYLLTSGAIFYLSRKVRKSSLFIK
jgi:hypothetical protein